MQYSNLAVFFYLTLHVQEKTRDPQTGGPIILMKYLVACYTSKYSLYKNHTGSAAPAADHANQLKH